VFWLCSVCVLLDASCQIVDERQVFEDVLFSEDVAGLA